MNKWRCPVFALIIAIFPLLARVTGCSLMPNLNKTIVVESITCGIPSSWEELRNEPITYDEWKKMVDSETMEDGSGQHGRGQSSIPINVETTPIDPENPEQTVNGIAVFGSSRQCLFILYTNARPNETVERSLSRIENNLVDPYFGLRTQNGHYIGNYGCKLVDEVTVDGISCPIYHITFESRFGNEWKTIFDRYVVFIYLPDMHYELWFDGCGLSLIRDLLETVSFSQGTQTGELEAMRILGGPEQIIIHRRCPNCLLHIL